ncbi:MAG: hypothetical protein WAM50_15940, partial [Pseudolabrys sp.]
DKNSLPLPFLRSSDDTPRPCGAIKDGYPASAQVISVSTTHPVDVLVLIKLSCCPRVTAKYSGELVGNHVAELCAVTVAVVSMVAQIPALML